MQKAQATQTTRRTINGILIALGVAILFGLFFVGYAFLQSPDAIRKPQFEHAHFRMQLLINGKAENFADEKYQAAYKPQLCSTELTDEPFHFHDKKDQFVHVHWKNMTGGLLLKYYGWNQVAGLGNALGYRFDGMLKPVDLYENRLPALPDDAVLYIYTGDENSFRQRHINEFLYQDFETFFGKASTIQVEEAVSLFDFFSAKAVAHNNENHEMPHTQEELSRLQNMLGNVVIFAQKQKPSEAEVRARFMQLLPLSDSTCGG